MGEKKGGTNKNPHAVPWYIFLVFFLLIIGIVGAGHVFYLNQKSRIERDAQQNLNAIAALKINQIENWLSERIGDGRMIQGNLLLMDELGSFLANPGDQKKSDSIRKWLDSFREIYGYQNALLADAAGRVLLSALPIGASIGPMGLDLIAAARRSGRVMISELHRSLEVPEIHQDIVIPVLGSPPGPGAEAGAASVDSGAVLLRIDPYRFLYPLIQSWPLASESAETLLVKKEGNRVVFLNELRHRKNTALTFRVSASEAGLPAALAVQGVSGLIEGMDYRRVPVLAALRPVPGTSWFMVAKVDKQEVFSGLRRAGLAIFAICLLLLVSSGSTVVILWLRQSRRTLQKQYEAELERRALARHFDYLVRYANDILILADTNSRIVEVNDQALRSYGYSREELLNLHLQDLRPKEQQADLPHQMKHAVRLGGLIYETVQRRKDGLNFPVEVSARVIDVDGRAFSSHIIRDISERLRAEEVLRESEQRLRQALALSKGGAWEWDLQTNENFWSEEVWRLYGLDPHSVKPSYEAWLGSIHPGDRAGVEKAVQDAARTGTAVNAEWRVVDRDGTERWLMSRGQPLHNAEGRAVRYIGTVLDITERKRAEDAIRELNAELEHRVLERTAELESVNRELEAFSYSVSHDLRTPLRAIDGFSKIVLEEYASALDPEARRLLGVIQNNTRQMGQLIDDLLDFSRLGRTEIHLSRIDVTSMARSVFEELLPSGEAGKTDFRVGSLPDAFSDQALIHQVWTNLLSNAIKFSAKNERRVVEVGGGTDGRENLYFVQDNGVGFDMQYNDKLFGVFQRLHSREEFEGTGVGLAIVKRIIQRLGGRVWAQGRVGAGATFSFSLPCPNADDMEKQHG